MDRRGGGIAPLQKERRPPARPSRARDARESQPDRAPRTRGAASDSTLATRASAIQRSSLADVAGALPAVVRILREAVLDDPVEDGRGRWLNRRDRPAARCDRIARSGTPGSRRRTPSSPSPSRRARRRRRRCRFGRPPPGPRVVRAPCTGTSRGSPSCVSGVLRRQRGEQQGLRFRLRRRLRQAEVEQLHARLREHHVAGLEVPVDDLLPVRLLQRVGDLHAVPQRLLEWQRPSGQAVGERLAPREILELAFAAHVVERADVRMGELRDRPGLSLEPLPDLRGGGEMRRQHLDRHRTLEPGVPGPVDLAHTSRADGREDLVRAETSPGCQSQDGSGYNAAGALRDAR